MVSISLRKARSDISLTYNGGSTDGLSATHFTVDEATLAIEFDLTCNLKGDKTNQYADALAYAEGRHAELASIQIYEAQVRDGLRQADARHPGAKWRLVVHIDGRDPYPYPVTICDEPDRARVVLRVRVAMRVVH